MGQLIQMIVTSDENSLFVKEFKDNQIVFRTTRNPGVIHREEVVIKKDIVYTQFYNFHISFLQRFLNN